MTRPIMRILNLAGYKFIPLNDTVSLQKSLLDQCRSFSIKGTILLSEEGININISGDEKQIQSFVIFLKSDLRFNDMRFHESYSNHQPFKTLKIKIKKEIITLKQPTVNPLQKRAPAISPKELKRWLDEKKDFTLLDTRNDYEVRFGTFENAINPEINDFGELPSSLSTINCDKPVVMFCTGGIRCEKAALYMLNHGFTDVHQLDGGILGYFRETQGSHYQGECFVFDTRVSVDNKLEETGTLQCKKCQGPIKLMDSNCKCEG